MKYYSTRKFEKLFREENLKWDTLEEVIEAIASGTTISLGKKLYKTRMRAVGKGKSGGYRVIAYVKIGVRIIFIVIFAKKERENLTESELSALKIYATELDKLTQNDIAALLHNGSLNELNFQQGTN